MANPIEIVHIRYKILLLTYAVELWVTDRGDLMAEAKLVKFDGKDVDENIMADEVIDKGAELACRVAKGRVQPLRDV